MESRGREKNNIYGAIVPKCGCLCCASIMLLQFLFIAPHLMLNNKYDSAKHHPNERYSIFSPLKEHFQLETTPKTGFQPANGEICCYTHPIFAQHKHCEFFHVKCTVKPNRIDIRLGWKVVVLYSKANGMPSVEFDMVIELKWCVRQFTAH